jgi:hypothetical protein
MKKLAQIQAKLKAPKAQRNNFGKYNYRSCEDILEAVKPLLDGATLTITDSIQEVGDRVYVQATATLTDEDDTVSVQGWAREALTKKGMDESQITGAASSYARKYALNGLFCIDDNKDADATNDHGKTPAKMITDSQKSNITSLAKQSGMDHDRVVKGIKWASGNRTAQLDELAQSEAAKLIGMLTNEAKKGEQNA